MKRFITSISVFLLVSVSMLNSQVSKQDLAKIDETVKKAFELFKPTGLAVAVMKDSAIVYHQALGFSNADTRKPVTTTSLFYRAGSSASDLHSSS